jgi:eukaryotic-like serine/threonine-protein kinase
MSSPDSLSSPTACPDRDTLEAYCLGKLPEPKLVAVAEHLSACAQCFSALESLDSPLPDSLVGRLRQCWQYDTAQEDGCARLEAAARAIPLPSGPLGDVTVPDTGAASPGADASSDTGEIAVPLPKAVGNYEILARLGEGGMGVVYKARQQPFGRLVALKTVSAGVHASVQARIRFHTEGQAISRLKHANVVQIHEFGEHEGTPFFSMELMEGGSLSLRLKQGPLPPREAAALVRTLAFAVEYAHQNQVLHRDLKPANILLAGDGTPKIADFGLAKVLDADEDHTRTNMALGTPSYMAPEQALARTRDIGPATDVYALGAILYEALTGRPVFKERDRDATLRRVIHKAPIPPSQVRRGVPKIVEAICLKCLDKAPARRYESAEKLGDDLRCWLTGQPTIARPPRWPVRLARWVYRHALALAVVVTLSATLATMYWRDPQREMDRIRAELRQGRAVDLINETGPPTYKTWVAGESRSQITPTTDGTFTLTSHTTCLLELLPDPCVDCYRLRGQIRHERSDRIGGVGLYVARKVSQLSPASYVFALLSYNDVRQSDLERWLLLPERLRQKAPEPKGNLVQLNVAYCFDANHPVNGFNIHAVGVGKDPFLPTGQGATGRWRQVDVLVSPKQIIASWDGVPLQPVPESKLNRKFGDRLRLIQAQHSVPEDIQVAPYYEPRGGLGIYLDQGSASFRSFQLIPALEVVEE